MASNKFKTKSSQVKPVTRIAFVIDESGSMNHLRKEVVDSFNAQLSEIQAKTGQTSYVSLWTFDSRRTVEHLSQVAAQDILPWNIADYNPCASTPLASAVREATTKLSGQTGAEDANLVIVITDGQENCSASGDVRNIAKEIKEKNATDRWTFVFIGPLGSKSELKFRFGAFPGNIIEWEGTKAGVQYYTGQTQSALSNYYVVRAAGVRAVQTFFAPDLSKVTVKQVAAKLDDVTGKFRKIPVDRECEIKSLVEAKTGKYIRGSAYYELTKKEKVQDYKKMLLVSRKNKKVYGGDVRGFLKVPGGTGVEVKMEPGNHADYRVFVLSTSDNRKLVRGTDVLVEK